MFRTGRAKRKTIEQIRLAREISETIISRLPIPADRLGGSEHAAAIEAGAVYFLTVLSGQPSELARELSTKALSDLMSCQTDIAARKLTTTEKIKRVLKS